jgi:sterol desaturase/sphingolipid hydroxylase (fatty acid hydroxylase superfamily)
MLLPQVAIGLASASAIEWLVHKYVLHGAGKKKDSFWRFHWREHHRTARKNDMYDDSYKETFFHPSRLREILGILLLMLIQTPFFWVAPWYVLATWVYSITYLWAHRKAHLDTAWGKRWMPWHVTHHLGRDQDQNWGVVSCWWDYVLGSRKKD